MADFKLVSADGHLNDPPEAWERVQKEYGGRAPRVVKILTARKASGSLPRVSSLHLATIHPWDFSSPSQKASLVWQ